MPSLTRHFSLIRSSSPLINQLDHRQIAIRQHLFTFHPSAPGMTFFLPHGHRILASLQQLLIAEYDRQGYHLVGTPLMFDTRLWQQSGHWDNYRQNMYSVHGTSHSSTTTTTTTTTTPTPDSDHDHSDEEDSKLGLKQMNFPAHCLIYASSPPSSRTYRSLPMRLADFSPLHRHEYSGGLTGLTRLRMFHQDDAHIFCTPAQVSHEIHSTLHMIHRLYSHVFKFDRYRLVLSTRPSGTAHSIGSHRQWTRAEHTLRTILETHQREMGVPWEINEGDGAFYGPKIDVRVSDAQGREHQLATVQLDFQLPRRFNLTYHTSPSDPTDADTDHDDDSDHDGDSDKEGETRLPHGQARPVMIHRAILGSLERFMAVYAEQCQGRWPLWISPRQILILPILPTASSSASINADADAVEKNRQKQILAQSILSFATRLQHHLRYDPTDNPLKVLHRRPYHVDMDVSDDLLKGKIYRARQLGYNYVVIVGQKEVEACGFVAEPAADVTDTGCAEGKEGGLGMEMDEVVVSVRRRDHQGNGMMAHKQEVERMTLRALHDEMRERIIRFE